jgi:hypothetical protein
MGFLVRHEKARNSRMLTCGSPATVKQFASFARSITKDRYSSVGSTIPATFKSGSKRSANASLLLFSITPNDSSLKARSANRLQNNNAFPGLIWSRREMVSGNSTAFDRQTTSSLVFVGQIKDECLRFHFWGLKRWHGPDHEAIEQGNCKCCVAMCSAVDHAFCDE